MGYIASHRAILGVAIKVLSKRKCAICRSCGFGAMTGMGGAMPGATADQSTLAIGSRLLSAVNTADIGLCQDMSSFVTPRSARDD